MAQKLIMSAIAVLCVQSTFAIDAMAAPADQPDSNSTGKAKAGLELEEVVVTARRKEEVLTTVPVSITAYSSDMLQKLNIQSFADYATRIPNVTFEYGQGSADSSLGFSGGRQTIIRGVAGENTTAYYINDTPIPSSVSPQTLNLDRIEVLKGPQGTLFGASSMGGNFRFITKQPSITQNSYTVQTQAGGTQNGGADYSADGMTNVVLVPDKVGLNAAFGYARESGFITRRFPDASGNWVSKDDQGRTDEFSGSLNLRIQVTDNLQTSFSAIGQISKMSGFAAAYVPLPAYRPVSYTVDRDRDVDEYSKDRWLLGSFVLNYAGSGFSVVSSTSYFTRRVEEKEDDTEGTNSYFANPPDRPPMPLSNNPAIEAININHDRRLTHETRLSFDNGTLLPHLSGSTGVFYQRTSRNFDQPGIFVPELEAVANGNPAYMNDQHGHTTEDNTAVFGELYYDVLPKLTITAGWRQYWIKQKTDPMLITGVFSSLGGDYVPELKTTQSGRVPKVVVSYKIGNAGTVYASAAQGFRLGGTQPPLPADICDADLANTGYTREQTMAYKPDKLWSYEVGAKNRFNNGISLSSAVFQIDWKNIQQMVLLPGCDLSFTGNAGRARIRGAEMEVSGQPITSVPLSIQFGLGYTAGELRDPGFILQQPNTQLVQVPKWTGTVSGYYERPLNNTVTLFSSADYSYTGRVQVANGDGTFVTRQSFNMVNGNIGVRYGKSQIMLYGKNLLDKRLNFGDLASSGFDRQDVDGNRLPRAAVSRPRQIGLQYRVDF